MGSPYYWALVAAVTLAFAVVDLEALRRRSMSRWHGASVAVYAGVWVVVVGLGLPVAPLGSVWWIFPVAVRIAVAVIFGGGQLLAGAIREEQLIVHPERRPPALPKRDVSEAELRAGEDYDAQWQVQDRQRNRELRFRARQERERRGRPLGSHPPERNDEPSSRATTD